MQIKTKMDKINKERAKIHLESMEDYLKKLTFQQKNTIKFIKFIYLPFTQHKNLFQLSVVGNWIRCFMLLKKLKNITLVKSVNSNMIA